MQPRKLGLALAVLGGLLWQAQKASAFSIEVTPLSQTFSAGVWDYAYTMTLSANNSLDSRSFFVYYDVGDIVAPFGSFTAGTTAVADWTINPELTTPVWSAGISILIADGGMIGLPDSAADTNVRFQYVGPGLNAGAASSNLGIAHLYSTQAPTNNFIYYGARWTDSPSGRTNLNTDSPLGPSPSTGNPPEPASLAILGLGAAALLTRRRSK